MRPRSHDDTIPAETAWCLTCGFKHTRKPDWLCPRCGMPAGSEPPARKVVASPEEEERSTFPLGSTVAGVALAANGVALLAGFLKHPASEHRWALLGAATVVLVLGLELLLKVSAGRWIAAAAVVLAALVVSEVALRERVPDLFRDPLPAEIRTFLRTVVPELRVEGILALVAFAVGCVLLVAGRPRVARIVAGAVLAAPLVAFEFVRALGLL